MSPTAILVLGLGVVLVLPIFWRIARRRFDPFEPIVMFALAWGAMFVVRPTAMLIRGDFVFFGVDISPTLDKAVLLGLLGAMGFVLGYEISLGPRTLARLPLPPEGELPGRTLGLAFAAATLGITSLGIFLVSSGGASAVPLFLRGRSPELDELLERSALHLWWFSLIVVPAALLAFAVAWCDRKPVSGLVAAGVVGLALLRVVPTGSRLYILTLVGGAAVFAYLHRNRRPGVVALAGGLAIALLVSFVLAVTRSTETREDVSSLVTSLRSSPSRVLAPVVSGADAEMVPALAGALLVIPDELPHRYGLVTIGNLVTRPVPRPLWSGKPAPHTLEVTAAVWPEARERGRLNPAFTPVMSFYWDFGLLGVLVGMALYGAIARLAYEYLLRGQDSAWVQILYAVGLWTVVVAVRFDPVLLVAHLVVLYGPLIAITNLASRWSRLGGRREPESA